MQKHIILLLLIALPVAALFSQSSSGATRPHVEHVKKQADGNFVYVAPERDSTAKVPDIDTGKTYTDRSGNAWPVYRSQRGALYALVTSKTGKTYRRYMPK